MPDTITCQFPAQQLGKDLAALAAEIRNWAPAHAERMEAHIQRARDAMSKSQYQVIAALLLACDEARSAAIDWVAVSNRKAGIETIHRLNREVSAAFGLHGGSPDTPEF